MSRVASHLSLVAGGALVPAGERTPAAVAGERFRLPEPASPTLSELFAAHPRNGGWAGFLLAHGAPAGPVLWVQERMAILESGRVHPPGLSDRLESGRVHPPGLRDLDLIHVEARDARAALWAMEEGLRCAALGLVIGELWGDPAALDFTATRRLAVAAERSGVACWLVRLGGSANLSGARMRWRVASAPSCPNPLDPRAPGFPAWDPELFRARGSPPGRWRIAGEAGTAHPVRLVAASGDRAVDGVGVGIARRLSA